MKVVFATPFLDRPTEPFLKALEECLPVIEAAGWQHSLTQYVGCPYISNARADMTRRALDDGADVVMYLDYDLSWRPEDMLKILSCDGLVVGGTYRFKNDSGEYMGSVIPDRRGGLQVREDGCIKADRVPAGFLRVAKDAFSLFAKKHPHLLYGDPMRPHLDLFNHGAIDGVWWGEDYAFCKRWLETGHDLWICPDLDLNHHSANGTCYSGNFHRYLMSFTEGV